MLIDKLTHIIFFFNEQNRLNLLCDCTKNISINTQKGIKEKL